MKAVLPLIVLLSLSAAAVAQPPQPKPRRNAEAPATKPTTKPAHPDLFVVARDIPKGFPNKVEDWGSLQFAAYKDHILERYSGDKFGVAGRFWNAKAEDGRIRVGIVVGEAKPLRSVLIFYVPKDDMKRVAAFQRGDKVEVEGMISDFEALKFKAKDSLYLEAKFYCQDARLK